MPKRNDYFRWRFRKTDRYFPKMIEGKNLLLFSPLGFHSNQKIHEINKIRLKINTKNQRFIKEKNIEINGFGVLKNEYEVIIYECLNVKWTKSISFYPSH